MSSTAASVSPVHDQLPSAELSLRDTVVTIPPGPWAVGVSGGADSVALLLLLEQRADLSLHVVHLNHQTRGAESDTDAAFVADLAARLHLPCTIAYRDEIESAMPQVATNSSERFRNARLALFRSVVQLHGLNGVLLAHHAGDQAETVLQRLLRGVGPTALAGMAVEETLATLRVHRPLLHVPAADLRTFLREHHQTWREDASNASPHYLRNRLRPLLQCDADLRDSLLALAASCRALRTWGDRTAPALEESFAVHTLADLPRPVARVAARCWLEARGVPPALIDSATTDRLRAMATDAATPARQVFPHAITVRRRAGVISTGRR